MKEVSCFTYTHTQYTQNSTPFAKYSPELQQSCYLCDVRNSLVPLLLRSLTIE